MPKVYIVVTEEWFGGAETGNMKAFNSKENVEKYAETISDKLERSIYEFELS